MYKLLNLSVVQTAPPLTRTLEDKTKIVGNLYYNQPAQGSRNNLLNLSVVQTAPPLTRTLEDKTKIVGKRKIDLRA